MTICIKNVNILDLKHNPDKPLDILISGDKISAIGNFPNKKSDQIIDGRGLYVCSGFVDIDSRLDHSLSILGGEEKKFLKQGVSDVFIGQGGFSLAPFNNLFFVPKLYLKSSNIDWQDINYFFYFLDRKKLWLNLGTFVGFGNLYNIVYSKKNNKKLTDKEFKMILKLLCDALDLGAFGLSMNWKDINEGRISIIQLEELLEILKKYSAIFSISLDNFSNTYLIINNLLETISKKEVKTLIGGYLNYNLTPEENILILKNVSKFYPDVYLTLSPYDFSFFYFYDFLPNWERIKNQEEILKDINDPWMRKKILNELPEINPEKLFFFGRNLKLNNQLDGKSLKELMEIYETQDWRIAFLNLMNDIKLRGLILCGGINQDVLVDSLLSGSSLIVSGNWSLDKERNVFLDFLNIVLENNLIDIKKAVFKISYNPINFLRLKNRGIESGCYANLVGFLVKDNKIEIKFIIINGRLYLADKEFSNPAGRFIKNII